MLAQTNNKSYKSCVFSVCCFKKYAGLRVKALLEFRALRDQLLQKHLTVGAKNAPYTSADTQNEIISICKSLVVQKIAKD